MNLSTLRSATSYATCHELFMTMSCLPYAIIKGEVLSIQAYGRPGQRNSMDIDILISRKYIKKVECILRSYGFNPMMQSRSDNIFMISSTHQTVPWIKNILPGLTVNIDLNFDIFWGEYTGKRLSIEDYLSDTEEILIYGQKVKCLSLIKAIIQLSLHTYKDMNSIFLLATRQNNQRQALLDMYHLLKRCFEWDLQEELYYHCLSYGIIPYIYYVLYYTWLSSGDEAVGKYSELYKTSEGEILLNQYGLTNKERKEWSVDFNRRLQAISLYELLKNDLTESDIKKIEINKRMFT